MMDIIGELAKSNPAKLELFEAVKVLECEKELNTELANRLHCYPGNKGKKTRAEIINMAINTVLEQLNWVDVRDRFPSDDEIAKDTEFLVKAENSKGNLINTVITCDKADKENREWTFGRYEREDNKPIFTVYEVVAWKKIEPYERKEQ